jgi:hypothetical protein
LRVGKHLGAELCPVDAAAGIEDLFPEALNDFLISGAPGLNQIVPDAVSINDVRAQVLEVPRHGAFSAGDASGEAKGKSKVRSPRLEVNYLQAELPSKSSG